MNIIATKVLIKICLLSFFLTNGYKNSYDKISEKFKMNERQSLLYTKQVPDVP